MATPTNDELIHEFCLRFSSTATYDMLKVVVIHLISEDLLDQERLRNYLIVKEFPECLEKNDHRYMDTTYQLAIKYELSERQVQNILYKQRKKR
ncbi:MAG: hypothetical protein SFW35_00895 [Chitinophagales bacterium]|nr:hypothetical protein [Chitinophagales bacterium]